MDGNQAVWPTSDIVASVPQYTEGKIIHTTHTSHSELITIAEVSKEEAEGYWEKVQGSGFTTIVSETKPSKYYSGFTYVATNGEDVVLSLNWVPGHIPTMNILVFAV